MKKIAVLFLLAFCLSAFSQTPSEKVDTTTMVYQPHAKPNQQRIKVGAEQTGRYFPLLQGKRIAVLSIKPA